MLNIFKNILEAKKELLVCVSLSVLYLTYYLVEVVKKPILICRKGEFRQLLEDHVPILNEYYWPTIWCFESRLQTVLGSVLRSLFLPPLRFRREVLRLSDGGQLALDWLVEEEGEEWVEGGGTAAAERAVLLVLPGLTGGAHADYVRCLAAAARTLRARLVVYNNRGLGGLPLTTPRLYSAVSYEDVAEAVHAVAKHGPVLAAGVSLGGLLLGRYLAEHGAAAQVHAALVVSSPLDVPRGTVLCSAHSAAIWCPVLPGSLLLGRYLAEHGAAAQVHAALVVSSPLDVPRGTGLCSAHSAAIWCPVPPGRLLLGRYLAEHGAAAQVHAALVSSPLDVLRGTVWCIAHSAAISCPVSPGRLLLGRYLAEHGAAPRWSQSIEQWGLNAALSWHMARQLRGTVRARLPAAAERVRGCRSVREFDAAFTAPHFGFASPDAYYSAASLRPRLHSIARPLLCLCAADDPFQPFEALPVAEVMASSSVALCVPARGGHIGFLEGLWPARPPRTQYLARLAHQYFAATALLPPHAPAPAAPAFT
ncbi:unnamed protein product [Parnassius apollo]|uniref:(apollo) hypothetical protein n=1 Tax=Parnassius apollo TaxID=110799 RepID=A0A8S3WJ69_PARAO|nr:unnamed protein product [Parnassius apollo]